MKRKTQYNLRRSLMKKVERIDNPPAVEVYSAYYFGLKKELPFRLEYGEIWYSHNPYVGASKKNNLRLEDMGIEFCLQ